MHGQEVPTHVERAIAVLAERQHGVVALWQLLPLGLGHDAVDYRVRIGRLHPIHRAVYAVGHPKLTVRGRWMAAVLACGPAAVLSHRDAAALWQIRRDSRAGIDVTAPGRSRHTRAGITLHRPRLIEADECTTHDGIPVTTVARTLVDLAAVVPFQQLAYAWDEAVRLRIFDLSDVEAVRARFRTRRGVKKIDTLIAQARPVQPLTRSDLERTAVELFRRAGLPEPSVNVWIEDMEVDFLWPRERVVVEVDGGPYHRTPRSRDRDNVRDARLQLLGYKVLRVSDRRLDHDPGGVVQDLRALLAAA